MTAFKYFEYSKMFSKLIVKINGYKKIRNYLY